MFSAAAPLSLADRTGVCGQTLRSLKCGHERDSPLRRRSADGAGPIRGFVQILRPQVPPPSQRVCCILMEVAGDPALPWPSLPESLRPGPGTRRADSWPEDKLTPSLVGVVIQKSNVDAMTKVLCKANAKGNKKPAESKSTITKEQTVTSKPGKTKILKKTENAADEKVPTRVTKI